MYYASLGQPDFHLVDWVNQSPISQALKLLPPRMDSLEARAILLKTGLQESLLTERRQLVNTSTGVRPVGPAAGLWQFEKGGGIKGCMEHPATRQHLQMLCQEFDVSFTINDIWQAIQSYKYDVLAAGLARLNFWWSPRSLPSLEDEQGSWDEYIFCWRPGKPHRHTWTDHHQLVVRYFRELEKYDPSKFRT